MQKGYRNIYQRARMTTGLTQEAWAEVLGISAEAVRQYESDRILPSDEVMLRMAEACGQNVFCYWHLRNKSRIARAILPEVAHKPMPEAVLSLLVKVREFSSDGLGELTRIAADGRIDPEESPAYEEAMRQLRGMLEAAWELCYAQTRDE